MKLTIYQSRKLRATGLVVVAGIILALIYTFLSDGLGELFPYINALIIGLLVALLISFLELYVLVGRFRRLTFIRKVLIRTLLYVVLITLMIFLVLVMTRMVRFDLGFQAVLISDEFQDYLFKQDFMVVIVYTVALAFTINFTRQMSRKMGQGVLWSFITGRYYKPKHKEMIFMFLKIKNSDKILTKLGRLQFHNFLNEFIYDITEPILIYRGVICQYVEDEVVVSWNIKEGLNQANCIRTFFDAKKRIHELKEKYYLKYKLVPQFQAGYHCGTVIQGEIGAIKSEIAFYGDVMNTTSRIVNQCSILNKELLLTAHLMHRLDPPSIYQSEICGYIELKGKEKPLELFSIREQEISQPIPDLSIK